MTRSQKSTSLALFFLGASTLAFARDRGPCAASLETCPDHGCSAPDSSHAIVNRLKRARVRWERSIPVTLDELSRLQTEAGKRVGTNREIPTHARKQLHAIAIDGRTLGEGMVVRLAGFLVGRAHLPSNGESVNCRLKGTRNNDLHFTLAAHASDLPFSGVVAEMIPQHRLKGWTVTALSRLKRSRRLVLVIGQLLYDNEHRVNANPREPLNGESPRMSLWEVHPVARLYRCAKQKDDCPVHWKASVRSPEEMGWVAVD